MKVLVATKKTQGQREDDFCFVPEGDLVDVWGLDCVGGDCACLRTFTGLSGRAGTTTVRVIEHESLDAAGLRDKIEEGLRESGYLGIIDDDTARSKGLPTDDELVNQQLIDILRVAGRFRVGAVLEKGGTEVRARDGGYLETQR